MSDGDPDADGSASTARDRDRQPVDGSEAHLPVAEAERYARSAAEQPGAIRGEARRILELLGPACPSEPPESALERRRAASTALARLARDDSGSIDGHVGELVGELRREHARELPADADQLEAVSREITDTLLETVAVVIAEQPETVAEIDDVSDYVGAITANSGTETLRTVTKAFFASASELQRPAPVVETLGELLSYPDRAVRTWSAGALGRLAEEHPGTVATTAADLRRLAGHGDEAVQHNAVEALGALVRERPDAVAPAADALRELLAHDDDAVQHNAAGVLGCLAKTHPDAVIPATEDLQELCAHEDEAIRRIATGTLARLARDRPGAGEDV